MRVAIIEPVGGHGGMNYYDFSLAKGLVDAGAYVIVYTCDKTVVPLGLSFEVKNTFKGIWGDEHKLLRAVRFLFCLLTTLIEARRNRIDLVHYHFFHYTMMELFCVLLGRLFGLKVVVTAHDVESFSGAYTDNSASRVLSMANKIIAHNSLTRNELIEKTNLSAKNLAIIPHGNYLSGITKKPSREEAKGTLHLSSYDTAILFFGQIKEVKGLDILLAALPAVIEKYPTLKLLIAGKVWKDEFSSYEKLINNNKLQDNIELYIGYIPDEDVATFYRSADLVILPYRKIYQSGVLLMAMSYGVPVVVSDLDGMVEVVSDGVDGFVFNQGSAESLSEKIIYALADGDGLKQISRAGIEKIQKDHDWCNIGAQTLKLYQSIQ